MSAEVVALRPRLTPKQQAEVVKARAMVRRKAAQIVATMPWLVQRSAVKHADLIAAGDAELSHAMTLYDASSETPFEVYAQPAVYGAMMNLLKRESRYQRAVWNGAQKANEALGEEGDGGPESWTAALEAFGDRCAAGMVMSVVAEDPEALVIERDLAEQVRAAVAEEPARERALIERSYFADEAVERAGRALGMSRSSIKRRHGKALDRIAARLTRGGGGGGR